jgi:hypothetical protein
MLLAAERVKVWLAIALALLAGTGVFVYSGWESKLISGALAVASGAIVLRALGGRDNNTS